MNFTATLRGVSFTDPKEFAAAVKAAPPLEPFTRAGKAVKVKMFPNPDDVGIKGFPIFNKPRITLTEAEKKWLGATVRRSDGTVGQVWALAPTPGYVWVVTDGYAFLMNVDDITVVQSRVDQLALSL